ncbi:MAG: type II secretion system F family protein [Burkholderiaceae bacterium]|nr:type II secretion system F family protein [Burkholderiaceae bacterium]
MRRGDDTLAFSRDFRLLLSAGLSVREALRSMADDPTGRHRTIAADVHEKVHSGRSLSKALEDVPSISRVLVAMVGAGETTGNVPSSIGRYVTYAERIGEARRRLAAALIYPAILLIVGLGVLGFILLFLVPRLAGVYASLNRDLPPVSRQLFMAGGWIASHPVESLLIAVALAALAFWMFATRAGRRAIVRIMTSIPWIDVRLRGVILGRLYRTLGMLTQSGIPLRQALAVAGPVTGFLLGDAIPASERDLLKGRGIATTLSANGLATVSTEPILSIGERAGDIGAAFERVADYLEERTAQELDLGLRIAEPVLGLLMSLAVGALLLLMYMPIIEISGGMI